MTWNTCSQSWCTSECHVMWHDGYEVAGCPHCGRLCVNRPCVAKELFCCLFEGPRHGAHPAWSQAYTAYVGYIIVAILCVVHLCCCRCVEQKDSSWRCGMHPPMTAAEVAAAKVGRQKQWAGSNAITQCKESRTLLPQCGNSMPTWTCPSRQVGHMLTEGDPWQGPSWPLVVSVGF